MTNSQHKRLDLINKANAGFVTVKEVAMDLGISERQVQRLKKEVREHGPAALIHKNSGRKPAHATADSTKTKILEIRELAGFKSANFTHFQELLETEKKIKISYSSLYRLLKSDGIKSPMTRRRFKVHRRRKRRPQAGNLVQMDASPYDWLGIGPSLALHGSIDDATGQVTGLYLCKNECLIGYHEVTRRMVEVFGIPEAAYADRHTIFRSPNADKAKADDAPPGIKAQETQFGRALSELGVKIIAARSPQAKGRIERLWGTLQSRLPVEFEIHGIKDIDSANEFLKHYVFAFNSEFAVEPADCDSAFLPLEEGKILDHILCVKEERSLDSGQVFSFSGKRYQIEDSTHSRYIKPGAKVKVLVSPRIGIKAAYLNYVFDTKPAPIKPTRPSKPAADEPKGPGRAATRHENAFDPKDGLKWRPGQPDYKESLEMINEIFNRPYSKTKKKEAKPEPTIVYRIEPAPGSLLTEPSYS